MDGHGCPILYILASPTWGGGEQYVYDLAKAMQTKRCECFAITAGSANRTRMSDVLAADRLYGFKPGFLLDIVSAWRMAGIIRKHGIGIVHVNKFSDAFLAVWARRLSGRRVRIVMTRHLIRKGKTGLLYKYLYRQIDRLIFVSELGRREFFSREPDMDPGKTCVIHNGIADEPQDWSARGKDGVTIAFAGRIDPEKGLQVLIEALSRLQRYDFRLKLIGKGTDSYMDTLGMSAKQHGLSRKIDFTGFTDDVNLALQEASIGVLPSIVREGFPMAVLEYMRSGLAIVASCNGGQAECLTDGENAFLVRPGDTDALTEALEKLLSDTVKRDEMGTASRRSFQSAYTYDKFLETMIKLYSDLCV